MMVLGALLFGGSLHAQTTSDPSTSDPGYDNAKAAVARQTPPTESSARTGVQSYQAPQVEAATSGCFIALDNTFTAIPRNDDGSYGPIALPFGFDLYGSVYNQVWINTNGNLTFTGAYSTYSPTGFPFSMPMVAPFWADVDTRNLGGGQIYFKLSATNLIVTWDHVGYYNQKIDKLNTFQVVISDGVDPITGLGQNVCFHYEDMQWTTGDASQGVNGFGGYPATVGANKGNSIDYFQVGRFGEDNANYDGPGGNTDGVHYLDNQCICVQTAIAENIPPVATNFPSDTILLECGETYDLDFSFIPPAVNQNVATMMDAGGACGTSFFATAGSISDVQFSFTAQPCNEGVNTIAFTATDDGTPNESTTVYLTIIVGQCCDPIEIETALSVYGCGYNVSCNGSSDGMATASATGGCGNLTYVWSDGQMGATATGLSAGMYTVTVTDEYGNMSEETITVNEPAPISANLPSEETIDCLLQPVTLTAAPTGGCAPYSYEWSTGETTASIEVNPDETTAYTVVVTDANGCVSTLNATTTVNVINRCGNNNQKVVICHVPHGNSGNPQTICISPNALSPHLESLWNLHGGDYCGPCLEDAEITTSSRDMGDNAFLTSAPNPFDEATELQFRLNYTSAVRVEVYSMGGELIETVYEGTAEKGVQYTIEIDGSTWSSGMYVYRFITDHEMHIDKLTKN